ncbi:hypothetical protein ACVWZZ_003440 [Bradyrhizobium sp. LM6.10]
MSGQIEPVSETLGALKTDVKYLRESGIQGVS